MLAEAKVYRDKLIEAVSDFDDDLAEKYLEGKEIEVDQLMLAIRKATISLKFFGVIPGSAFKKKGVQRVLDCVVNYLPSPIDVPPMTGKDSDGRHGRGGRRRQGQGRRPRLQALDRPVRRQARLLPRLHGQGEEGDLALQPAHPPQRARLPARSSCAPSTARRSTSPTPGDICALVGVKDVITGDTLCDEDFDIRLEPPSFPEPVISMSIEPNSKADQEKMGTALQRLVAEDPTLRVKTDTDTGQVILSGMGELHLEIILDRMKREFKVEATSGKPQIAYRETVKGTAEGEGKFIRQSGGKGQYGHVLIKLEPNEKGKGIEVINETVGGSIPKEFIKPSIDGIMEGSEQRRRRRPPGRGRDRAHHRRLLPRGRLLGARVQDGRHLRVQGRDEEGQPDPARADHGRRGDDPRGVPGRPDRRHQLRRRGTILGMENKAGACIIAATVPLETLFGYVTDIRSLSKGRASASVTPSHFEQVPNSLLQKIIDEHGQGPGPQLTPVLFSP